jgi:hypothetical protein
LVCPEISKQLLQSLHCIRDASLQTRLSEGSSALFQPLLDCQEQGKELSL